MYVCVYIYIHTYIHTCINIHIELNYLHLYDVRYWCLVDVVRIIVSTAFGMTDSVANLSFAAKLENFEPWSAYLCMHVWLHISMYVFMDYVDV